MCRHPRATTIRPDHPARRPRGRASASNPGRRRRRSPPARVSASAGQGPGHGRLVPEGSALHLKKTSPSADAARRTTDRFQSWCHSRCVHDRPGRPPPSARPSRPPHARANPGGTTPAEAATSPRHAHGPTRPRRLGTISGSSRAITSASRSSQVQPWPAARPWPRRTPPTAWGPRSRSARASPLPTSAAEVRTTRKTAVAAGSTTTTEARISARLGSALPLAASATLPVWRGGPDRYPVVGNQDGDASRMRDQQTHLAAVSRLRVRHSPRLPWIQVPRPENGAARSHAREHSGVGSGQQRVVKRAEVPGAARAKPAGAG